MYIMYEHMLSDNLTHTVYVPHRMMIKVYTRFSSLRTGTNMALITHKIIVSLLNILFPVIFIIIVIQ